MARHANLTPDRFDESFIIRTLRDFFIGLVVIVLIELAARFALVIWNYKTIEETRTEQAAHGLAEDVRSIMLNRGGPVAARTVYPILQRDYRRLGLDIAIEPSAATVEAVTPILKAAPRGIPPDWDAGEHHETRVAVEAEAFCLQCHSASKIGDTLGWVTVRNYRARHIALWWEDVRLSGLFTMVNVIIDTIILFAILSLRMEPILRLRSVVSRLSKAGSTLSHRAPVRSPDEFGELAHDLNLFLDRLTQINDDMSRVLGEIGNIAARMQAVSGAIDGQAETLAGVLARSPEGAGEAAALEALLEGFGAVAAHLEMDEATQTRLADMRARWQEARAAASAAQDPGAVLRALAGSAGDMRLMEERMRALAEEGQRLLSRLGQGADAEEEGGA